MTERYPYHFHDLAGNDIALTFTVSHFTMRSSDVLLFPFFNGRLAMTKHKSRGWELPGGKVERGEMPIQAAIREMWEETGGILLGLEQIGEYYIKRREKNDIRKAIYFAKISHFEPLPQGFETEGYRLFSPDVNVKDPAFSPYLQDEVFPLTLRQLKQIGMIS